MDSCLKKVNVQGVQVIPRLGSKSAGQGYIKGSWPSRWLVRIWSELVDSGPIV